MFVAPLLYFLRCLVGFLLVDARIAAQVDRLRREGEAGPGGVHDVHDAKQKIFPYGLELAVVASEDVTEYFHGESAGIESNESATGALSLNFGMFVEQATDLHENIA